MEKARALEIILKHCGNEIEQFQCDDYSEVDGNVVYVDGYWGSEGGGEDVYKVYKIVDDNESALICFYGRYSSWDGTEWDDDFVFVEAKEETVIKYYPIKGK